MLSIVMGTTTATLEQVPHSLIRIHNKINTVVQTLNRGQTVEEHPHSEV